MSRLLLLFLFLTAACGKHTETRLVLGADPAVLADAASLSVTITSDGVVRLEQTEPVSGEARLGEIPVIPLDADTTRRFTFEGNIRNSNGDIISTVNAEFGYVDCELTIEQINFEAKPVQVTLPAPIVGVGLMEDMRREEYGVIPGTKITVPTSNAKSWLILAYSHHRGGVRLTIDGEEISAATSVSSSRPLRAWMTAYVLRAEQTPATAQIEIYSPFNGNFETTFAKILAIPLNAEGRNAVPPPENFDPDENAIVLQGDPKTIIDATIPVSDEQSLAIVSFALRRVGGGGTEIWLEGDGGKRIPAESGFGTLQLTNPLPFSLITTVPASSTPSQLKLMGGATTGSGSLVSFPRIVLIPESAFRSFATQESPPSKTSQRNFEIVDGLNFSSGKNLLLQHVTIGMDTDPVSYRFLANDISIAEANVETRRSSKESGTVNAASVQSEMGRAQNQVRASPGVDILHSFIGAFELF